MNETLAAELFEQAMRGDVGPAYNALGTMHYNGQARPHLHTPRSKFSCSRSWCRCALVWRCEMWQWSHAMR